MSTLNELTKKTSFKIALKVFEKKNLLKSVSFEEWLKVDKTINTKEFDQCRVPWSYLVSSAKTFGEWYMMYDFAGTLKNCYGDMSLIRDDYRLIALRKMVDLAITIKDCQTIIGLDKVLIDFYRDLYKDENAVKVYKWYERVREIKDLKEKAMNKAAQIAETLDDWVWVIKLKQDVLPYKEILPKIKALAVSIEDWGKYIKCLNPSESNLGEGQEGADAIEKICSLL